MVAVLVLAGLAVCVLANVWIEAPADGELPGVALESQTILVVERVAALFAGWLAVLVVCGQAIGGRLPTELSGRGVRYADAESSQAGVSETERALQDLDARMVALQAEMVRLETHVRGRRE